MKNKANAKYKTILLQLCSAVAMHGDDAGAVAECVLTALHKAGFSKKEVEAHMDEDLLSFKWFVVRGIKPLLRRSY